MERKKGVILSYGLMILEILSTLLITPYLLKTLGQAEYGVYKLSASITTYLLLLDLGVGNAIIRYIAKFRQNKDVNSERKFLGIAIIFYSIITLLTIIGGIVLIKLFPTVFSEGLTSDEIILGKRLLRITVLNAAVTIGTTVFNNILIAYEKFTVSKGASILQIILRMALTLIVLKLGMSSIGVVSVNLLMTVLCRGFCIIYVSFIIKLRPKFKEIDFSFIKDIIIYSSLILIQMVATQINSSMDQILLGSLVTSSSTIIAIYSVGTQVVQYFQSIGSSFTGVLMPGVVQLVEKGSTSKSICDEMVRIGRIILIILSLVWSGFIVFGKQFILLWAGPDNTESYYIAVLLMTAYLFILTEAIGTQILWAKNEYKEQSFLKLGIVLVNILLTIFLIRWNPLIGATIGTFISLVVGDIFIMNFIYKKKLNISLKQYYSGLFKGLLICVFITTGFGFIINLIPIIGWIGLIIKIILLCLIYTVLLWIFGMNNYEKNLIKSLFKKIF